MTEAIFGLIGVLIGGLLSGGVNFAMEHRRLRTDCKIAARLVGNELEANDLAIEQALSDGDYGGLNYLMATEWEEQRGALAAALSNEEWTNIGSYYLVANHVIGMAHKRARDQAFDNDVRKHVESLRRAGTRAVTICQSYTAATKVQKLA